MGTDVGACLAVHDCEEDEGDDPGILFECVDEREAEDGDDVGDYGDDHTAYADAHVIVGDGGEHLAGDHDVDDCETSADYNVQDGAQLCAPESEAVSRCRNLTESCLRSQGSSVGGT